MKNIKFEKLGHEIEIRVNGKNVRAYCEGKEVDVTPCVEKSLWVYKINADEHDFKSIFHSKNNKNLCLSHPTAKTVYWDIKNAEIEEKKAEELKERKANEAMLNEKPIELYLYEGDILTGYMAKGVADEMLEEIGAAKYIAGWGIKVNNEVVEALGTSFTYNQVKKFMDKKTQEKKETEQNSKSKEKLNEMESFMKAKKINKPVLIKSYTAPCDDPSEECDVDIVNVFALPDGSKNVERIHTW